MINVTSLNTFPRRSTQASVLTRPLLQLHYDRHMVRWFHPYYASCSPYKTKNIGTAVNDLDAPVLMDAGGNIGQIPTRVLHYQYDCDQNFGKCKDEEQFFLGNDYGLWQWKHYKKGKLKKTAVMNDIQNGIAAQMLPCPESYK